jgi:hypothetical protein
MSGEAQAHEGYMENALGHLIPLDKVKPVDLARHELVMELARSAMALQSEMKRFRDKAMGDVEAFADLSAEMYEAPIGGKKGNVRLVSFDGRFMIQRQISENLVFDERLQAAKALIDQCITRWAEGSNNNIKALVNSAFNVDREGRVNVGRILGLRSLDISDPDWLQAMKAITDSIQVAGSKAYLRLYKRRDSDGKYEAIPLDLAAL